MDKGNLGPPLGPSTALSTGPEEPLKLANSEYHPPTYATTLQEQALQYAKRGWPVVPFKKRKAPCVKGGYKAATTDPEKIQAWWGAWPRAAIGIRTGSESGLVVIDCDLKGEGDGIAALKDLERVYGALPQTSTARSGSGGLHLYFRDPGGIISSNGQLHPFIDVRAEKGAIIAPPSPHATGGSYQWETSPEECPPAPLPQAWTELIQGICQEIDTQRQLPRNRYPETGTQETDVSVWAPSGPTIILDELNEALRNPGVGCQFVTALGFDGDRLLARGELFVNSPLRKDRIPSAGFRIHESGRILFTDWGKTQQAQNLAELRKSLSTGDLARLERQPAVFYTWALRVLYEAGALEPRVVPQVTLSESLPESTNLIFQGFCLLVGLKWRVQEWAGNGVTFSQRFAAEWCDVWPRQEAGGAIRELREKGYIEAVGETGKGVMRTPLYMLGTGAT